MQNRAIKNAVFFTSGLLTAVLSLAVVYLATVEFDFNLMSFWLIFIIPIGAIGVGMMAASGYGISARLLGVKITPAHLAAIAALQLIAYFGAQYVEFLAIASTLQADLPPGVGLGDIDTSGLPEELAQGVQAVQSGFWGYFDYRARAFSFSDFGAGGMGGFGYIFQLLQIAGFVGGTWLTLNLAGAKPFCDDCQVYYQEIILGFAPFHEEEDQRHGLRLEEAVVGDDLEGLLGALADPAIQPKDDAKLGSRLQICHWGCPQCHEGWFQIDLVVTGGDQTTRDTIMKVAGSPALHQQFKARGGAASAG